MKNKEVASLWAVTKGLNAHLSPFPEQETCIS